MLVYVAPQRVRIESGHIADADQFRPTRATDERATRVPDPVSGQPTGAYQRVLRLQLVRAR